MVAPDHGAFANIKRKNQIIQSSNSMLNVKKVKSKVIIIKETYQNSKSEAINKKVQMKKQKSALSNNSLSKKESIKSNKKNRDGANDKGEEQKIAGPDTNMIKKGSKKDKTN